MTGEDQRKELETTILKIIEEKIAKGEMSAERARAIAKLVIEKIHPPITEEQLYEIAPLLDDTFQELSPAILPILKKQDEHKQTTLLQNAQELLKSNKIDEALAALKQQK
jgi:polyhydroxyalkanoate synthesis regulator phasin